MAVPRRGSRRPCGARERAPEAEVFGVASDLGTGEGVEELVRQVPETDILTCEVQNTKQPELRFRALLTEGGFELKLARA